jgi:hypothetical protein
MRKLLYAMAAAAALGLMAVVPSQASASWLSEALHHYLDRDYYDPYHVAPPAAYYAPDTHYYSPPVYEPVVPYYSAPVYNYGYAPGYHRWHAWYGGPRYWHGHGWHGYHGHGWHGHHHH